MEAEAPAANADEGFDMDKFEHDLIAALEAEEGRELEEMQPRSSDEDGEIEDEGPKKKKSRKKKKDVAAPSPPQKPAAPKKPGRGKKGAGAAAPDGEDGAAVAASPRSKPAASSAPMQLPKMPASGPGASVLETDLAQARLWIKDLVAHAEEALLSDESVASARANRVVAGYAKVLREAVLAVANLEKRYEEAHRVFVAYSFEARRTETYGDRRGAGAYAAMGK